MALRLVTDEDRRQFAFLNETVGAPGSGNVRYAAAMHFFRRGMLSAAALEVYRVCSKLDAEDPRDSLRARGLIGEIEVDERRQDSGS